MEGKSYFNQAREGEERRGAGRTVGDRAGAVAYVGPSTGKTEKILYM